MAPQVHISYWVMRMKRSVKKKQLLMNLKLPSSLKEGKMILS